MGAKNTDNITEPEIAELLKASQNITFTTDNHKVIDNCDIMYVMVATPSLPNGSYDVTAIYEVVQDIVQRHHLGLLHERCLVLRGLPGMPDCRPVQ